MTTPDRWLKTFLRAARRRRFEQDLDQELRFHLDMEIEALTARGHSPEEARTIAERNFGGVERHKDSVRDVRGRPSRSSPSRRSRSAAAIWSARKAPSAFTP